MVALIQHVTKRQPNSSAAVVAAWCQGHSWAQIEVGNIGILPQHRADCASWKSPKRRGKGMENSFRTPCWCREMVCVVRAPPQPGGHIALLLLPPTQHWGETHTVTHTRTILLRVDTVYFLICLILWCKCSVLLSCGVQGRGVGERYIWAVGWDGGRGGSPSPSLPRLPPVSWGETFSLLPFTRFSSRLKRFFFFWETPFLLKLITSTFLTLLCLCCCFLQILACCDDITCV